MKETCASHLSRPVFNIAGGGTQTRDLSNTSPDILSPGYQHTEIKHVGYTEITTPKVQHTESAAGRVSTIVSAESLRVRRLCCTTFLVIFLHEWLSLVPLQLNELYLVEQDVVLWQLEVSCTREKKNENTTKRESISAAIECHRRAHSATAVIAALATGNNLTQQTVSEISPGKKTNPEPANAVLFADGTTSLAVNNFSYRILHSTTQSSRHPASHGTAHSGIFLFPPTIISYQLPARQPL